MGNCCTAQGSAFGRSRPEKDDDQMTAEDYRKEFRGSVVDLEYFYNKDPVHRRSLIKKIRTSSH